MRELIPVQRREILFENGGRYVVDPFEISKYPVLLSEFTSFCQATGYRTTAELSGAKETYFQNSALRKLRGRSGAKIARECGIDLGRIEATCVSHLDVQAYCQWSGTRLPTEAEWLAASVLNWEDRFNDGLDAINRYASHPSALKCVGSEWTATMGLQSELLKQNRKELLLVASKERAKNPLWAVVRIAPVYVLTTDWDEESHGLIAPVDFFHVMVTFRVCSIRKYG